jgi:D-alanyl-D-alanine carboxypeptidase
MTFSVRCVSIVLALLGALILASPASANSKYAAFVVHAESGDVLLDKYADSYRYPASLTKMMTLYLLFEELEAGRLSLDSKLSVSAQAAGQPPSKLGVKSGETISVDSAIDALVIKSSNDIAVVVAEAISGSEWKFAQKMTSKARELGMRRTTFRNASGLPNSKQKTTARDMATLGRRISQDFPQYFDRFSRTSFTWDGRTYRTHNALLKTFDGADGLKTGYTRMSGFNLATSAERNNQRLIGVVLGGRSVRTRDAHMKEILTNAFALIEKKPTLIAALHRETPSPRIKPTLLAQLELEGRAPTIARNVDLQNQIYAAAESFGSGDMALPADDAIGALISATADSDDFNEYERVRLAAFESEFDIGQGDLEDLTPRDWVVQIGAYSSKDLAQRELETAAEKAGLADRARNVAPFTGADGKDLYRARFIAMTQSEAQEACVSVKNAKLSCFARQEALAIQ